MVSILRMPLYLIVERNTPKEEMRNLDEIIMNKTFTNHQP